MVYISQKLIVVSLLLTFDYGLEKAEKGVLEKQPRGTFHIFFCLSKLLEVFLEQHS